jgi:hypothetical protein
MREIAAELKELRLYGMAGAWEDLVKQGGHATLESSRWLLEHLLQAEVTDRAMRSVSYQMHTAKFPVHRDLAGFDFECSPVDEKLIMNWPPELYRQRPQRGVDRWAGHRQDASGHGPGGLRHHPARTAGAFLLDRGPGQCAGAGEGGWQVRADRPIADAMWIW